MWRTCQKSVNFQNNPGPPKEGLNKIGFMPNCKYLKSSLAIYG